MRPELADDLGAFLGETGRGRDDYAVERTLKETEAEATELVRDNRGELWVRKLFCRDDPSIETAYRAIQRAGSPYLPQIRDLHRSTAGTVVVREYFAGPTLREWVGSYGPLDEARARDMLLQLCQGVQALHSCDPPLIHRDIKPENVIVTVTGPRLIDFGIARAYDEHASRDTHAWGTTGYAAPEQFGFDQSDARTDVFALGMLYWFMLTGADPEPNLSARLRRDDGKDVTLRQVPERARTVIGGCVALAPAERYANVTELARALLGEGAEEAGTSGRETTPAPSPSPARRTRGRVGKLLARAWLVVSSGFMAFLAFAAIFTLVEPWRLSVPEGWAHALVFCLGLIFMFAPAWLLSTDLFHVRERLPLLRRHAALRCALIALACFVAGAFIANAATQDLPAAYLQLAQEHLTTI